jgi:hypothetical protein
MIQIFFRPFFLVAAACFVLSLGGCVSAPTDLKVTSIQNHQTFRQPFTHAYCRRDAAGNVDVVLMDDAAKQSLAGHQSGAPIRQIMHVRVLWVPSREMKAVASNASIKWYVIGQSSAQDVLEYSGSAFVAVNNNDDVTSISIQNALLHPSDNHGSLVDPVGPSKMEGTVIARVDDGAVRQVLDDLHTTVAAANENARAAAMP